MKTENITLILLLIGFFMLVKYTPSETPKPVEEYVEKVNPLECKKVLLEMEYSALKKELKDYEGTKEESHP